ncbi:hypothetical protein FS749_006646 [Ceratobasidium sp. UAMH 11750]|nr:hypothetical protein FS749_006646 [Ceratobasidium sp. UAMH 11750]
MDCTEVPTPHFGRIGYLTRDLNPPSSDNQPIAHGGFGSVFKEKLRDGRQVAIKALRVPLNTDDEADKLPKRAARELYTWSKCQHLNVLPLLGLAQVQGQIRMVSLWMENGSLPAYLAKHPGFSRCDMAMHVCNGLKYLHDTGIIHGDLKGNNVLVSSEGIPMITDFGNAVLQQGTLQFTETVKQNGFTLRWTAPEILDEKEKQSKKADVYALGMTILEVITGKVPYFYINGIIAVMRAIAIRNEIPERPEDKIPSDSQHGDILWSLLQSCWDFQPKKRPGAAEVAEIMKGITREGLMPAPEAEEAAEAETVPERPSKRQRVE